MPRLAFVVVSFVAFVGCNEHNPASCELAENAANPECSDATTGGLCKSNTNCASTPSFPVCDLMDNGGTCVLCTANDHAACTGMTPHCEDHACGACVDDNDCDAGAGVCLPSGGCAAPSSIIHAKSNGALTLCGDASNPCSLDAALLLAKLAQRVIKLDDAGPYISAMNNFIVDVDAAKAVAIDARNAVIQHNGNGPIFTINDGKGMTILGGTIEGATGSGADGIRCNNNATLGVYGTTIQANAGWGINATGYAVTLSRSRIMSNQGGGINIANAKFAIVGNMFLNNGDSTAQYPAVTISTPQDNMNRFEFNTIANNAVISGNATAGVDCRAGAGFAASHNIIWSNMIGTNVATAPQTVNNCMHVHSDIGPMANADPTDISDSPLLSADGHLGAGSPALQKAEPGADLSGLASRDIDGDLRVAPADLGADQVPRP